MPCLCCRVPVEAIIRRIRSEGRAVLGWEERFEPVRYVVDPHRGAIFLPVEPEVLKCESVTLHVPDDTDESAVSILGAPRERHAGDCDRYLMYYGAPGGPRWMEIDVESFRCGAEVFDVDEVVMANPWCDAEAALVRSLNMDRRRLAMLCRVVSAGASPQEPVAVGVDPMGIDVRASFGFVRVEFEPMLKETGEMTAACDALLEGGS